MPDELYRDVVVVLPGIMGSTLENKDGDTVWSASAGMVVRAIRTFGRSIKSLQLPEGIGDEHPGDGVVPVAIMPDFHVLPGLWSVEIGYEALLSFLRSRLALVEPAADDPSRPANLLPFPYDWRLSNRYNGRRLKSVVEPALERWRAQGGSYADARLVFICHSMGGLVARWYTDCEGGAEVTRKLITLGTPHRGALNALDQLVNGVQKGVGPLKLSLTPFARSIPSVYQLLPEYACIESPSGLQKTTETTIPEVPSAMVADAMLFHLQLDDGWAARPDDVFDFHPIVGFRQPTRTTARIVGGKVETDNLIEGKDEGGDATVPRLSATPRGVQTDSAIIRSAADRHGALPANQGVLDELEFALGAVEELHRDDLKPLSVDVDELYDPGEAVVVTARAIGERNVQLVAAVHDESGRQVGDPVPLHDSVEGQRGELGPLPPGGYRVVVGAAGSAATRFSPVTAPILVLDDMTD